MSEGLEMKDFLLNFDIAAITFELKKKVIDKYIDNVYHLNANTIMLRLKPGPIYMILEASRRVHITNYKFKTPTKPIDFAMSLRKHLSRGKIIDINQPQFERVVEFLISSKNGNYRFIVEIFRRGNMVLIDQEGIIIAALRTAVMKDRKIIVRKKYLPAPSEKLSLTKVNHNDLFRLKENHEENLEKAITNLLAIDRIYTKELLFQAGLDGTIKSNELSEDQIENIFKIIKELGNKISKKPKNPSIVLSELGDQIDVIPNQLKIYEKFKKKEFNSFNEAVDEYFSSILSDKEKVSKEGELFKKAEKLNRILENQIIQSKSFKKAIEVNRKKGEIIYLHLNEIRHLSQLINSMKKEGHNWKDIERMIKENAIKGKKPEIYFQKTIPEKLGYSVKIDDVDILIGLRHEPQYWASQFYKKAKKIEEKLPGLESSVKSFKIKIKNLEEEKNQTLKEIPQLIKRREKEWFEKFRWFESSKGFLVLCGRDASNNELLIKRYMNDEDIVLHAEVHGAPFTIIRTEGKDLKDDTVEEAATFAACYSKAWTKGFTSIDLYWINPSQISKQPPSGQYLTKGMFMIRGPRNYVKGVTLRLAIGAIIKDNHILVVAGPTSAIKKRAKGYVEIIPGKTPSGKLAKQIKKILISKISKEYKTLTNTIELNEIQILIPSGKADLDYTR